MSDNSTTTTDQRRNLSVPAILRSFEIAETTVAGIKIGSAAVKNEVKLGLFVTNETLQNEQDSEYLGEIEINHSTLPEPQLEVDNTNINTVEEPKQDDGSTPDPLERHYIADETIEPTKDDPYPKYPPLLAPN
jgi:hypothetical protein